jgi:hypothetical protein
MAQTKGQPAKGAAKGGSKGKAAKKQKQPTQRPAQQRVAVMGPTGKIRFEWRPWN